MKILATSDWHLGNLFHGNDRLPEHKHFLGWLLRQVEELQPDALLVAGDIFDNGNPSAAAQSAYYEFLADVTKTSPDIQIIITAGNHDSASRLEAPRPLLSRHKVEIRGTIHRTWQTDGQGGSWQIDYDDLIIPLKEEAAVLAVPYLRSDMVQDADYSSGVRRFLKRLTDRARERYPRRKLVMMAHMYATGADIARKDASEKIVVGGQEQVDMENWTGHPDYLTCGHIHKRQPIRNTGWARYTGSVLPMSFAEKDYTHGVDLVTLGDAEEIKVEHLLYEPQHRLRILPEDDLELTPKKLEKLIHAQLSEKTGEHPDEHFDYVVLKVKQEKVSNDDIKELERLVNTKNAVLCKIQKIIPAVDIGTLTGTQQITSIDDILDRDPMETISETFLIHHQTDMNEHQKQMLTELLNQIKVEENN